MFLMTEGLKSGFVTLIHLIKVHTMNNSENKLLLKRLLIDYVGFLIFLG